MFAAAIFAIVVHGGSSAQGTVSLQLWQLINLLGAPLLALMFLPAAAEDFRTWLRSQQSTDR